MSMGPIGTRSIVINPSTKLILISPQRRATPDTAELVRNVSREILFHMIVRAVGRHGVFSFLIFGSVEPGLKIAVVAD